MNCKKPIPCYDMGAPQFQLITERTYLRPFQLADLPAVQTIHSHPDVVAHLLVTTPWDLPTAERMLRRWIELQETTPMGPLAVVRAADHTLIGRCGIRFWTADEVPEQWAGPEIGYSFAHEVWGQGYALEASLAVCRHADYELNLPKLHAFIRPGNTASTRLAARLGFALAGHDNFNGGPMEVWRRLHG